MTTAIAADNPSNAIMGLYGVSGSGKSRQCDEAARDVAQRHGLVTRMLVPDLGGWGTSRQSLIANEIVQVWYPCNHREPFATMELATQGWWPTEFIDPAVGLAAPDVPLAPPVIQRWQLWCSAGHLAGTVMTPAAVATYSAPCPTCHTLVTAATCATVEQQTVRTAEAQRVGLYVFDSMTQLNEWGMADRASQGALVTGRDISEGPSAIPTGQVLRSAMALTTELPEARFVYGTNDKTHYGFLQERTRQWIANIRAIPYQRERAIVTFGVEVGKGSEDTAGLNIYGPKISGNARTALVPGWVGNCFHLTNTNGRFRMWLTNHVDEQDPRGFLYLAKHRGEPGLPAYLEDDPGEAPFTKCSLRYFAQLERAQLFSIKDTDRVLTGALKTDFTELVVVKSEVTAAVAAGSTTPERARRRGVSSPTPGAPTPGATLAPPANGGIGDGGSPSPVSGGRSTVSRSAIPPITRRGLSTP
jgi:hypothetical protein